MWIYVKRLSLFFNFPIREDKNTVWAPQRQSPGCDRVWFKGPPASRWAVRPYVWRVRCLRTHAVPRQLRPLLVCGPKWTGDPWDSLGAWQKTNVWVNQCTQNQTLHEQWSNTNRATWKRHRRYFYWPKRFLTLRYQPRCCSTTCWTHNSTQCLPPAPRNTPVVFPERQDRPHPTRRLPYEEGWCQGCPPSPCEFLFVGYILFWLWHV